MLGQACIHVFCMAYGVSMAKEVMGPDELKAVLDFHKAARAKELPEQQNSDEDPWAELKTMWMAPFKPNLLNTVVFLVETSQMIGMYVCTPLSLSPSLLLACPFVLSLSFYFFFF